MEDVCKETGVSDQQLDQEIPEGDIIRFAEKFPHLLSVHKVGSTLNHNIKRTLIILYSICARGAKFNVVRVKN